MPLYPPPARWPAYSPRDNASLLGCSAADPIVFSQGYLTASGVLHLARVQLPGPTAVSNITVQVTGAGATLTAAQNLAGIYNSAGTLLGSTADQSAVWNSTGTKTMAVTGAPITVNPGSAGFVWVGVLPKGTTPPTFAGYGGLSSVNTGTVVSTAWQGTYSSALTALPSPLTPASIIAGQSRLLVFLT